MRILVTGGAGYVGSHCVKHLHELGHHVVVYDNLTGGHRQALPEHVTLIRGDLLDRPRLARTFEDHPLDAVIHFAGLINVGESMTLARLYYENNVLGTMNLLGEMMNHNVKHLVFSSTCAVYGVPPRMPIVEDMPKSPINPYGRTKWVIEMALDDCARADGLGSVSLRYFNASGAATDGSIGEDHDPEFHLIPIVLQVALGRREHVLIFGTDYPTPDGTAVRDYVHVDDLASAHLAALNSIEPGKARAYNVGTGQGTSVRQIIERVRRLTGHAVPAVEGGRREGDPAELYADPALIQRELAWHPRYDIDHILKTAWHWHRDHPDGYEE
jgi:UDP-glucose-4-epimerase GalE